MAPRDESQTVQVGLRVKEPLRAALEEAAKERGTSMNAEIVRRLERSFEERDIDTRALFDLVLTGLAEIGAIQGSAAGAQSALSQALNVLYQPPPGRRIETRMTDRGFDMRLGFADPSEKIQPAEPHLAKDDSK